MKTRHGIILAVTALAALSACVEESAPTAGLPQVGNATDITSFQGAKAGQSEMGIQALGYEAVRTEGLTILLAEPRDGRLRPDRHGGRALRVRRDGVRQQLLTNIGGDHT